MTTQEIESAAHQFLVENFIFDPSARVARDDSLLASGIVDSTGVLEVIMWIESAFGVTVEDQEVLPDNLDSISSIAAYIQQKLLRTRALAS